MYSYWILSNNLMKAATNTTYSCKCSFLEIYNEQVTDLLEPASTMMQIREDSNRGVYVEGLREEAVDSTSAAHNVLLHGSTNRHVGYTAMNAASSCLHSVLTLSVHSCVITSEGLTNVRFSKLSLIDLAGLERQKSTNTAGARLKEAGNINKSLSALGNVIRALVDIVDGKPRHVHYRDSKLTFLLKDSLGGNSKTCMVATISPSDSCFGETLSTLKFAQRAKLIRNAAIINEDVAGNIPSLQAEVRRLKELLAVHTTGARTTISAPLGSAPAFERVRELEVLLSKALDEGDDLQKEMSMVDECVKVLTELCERKDKFVLNTKMVIRLRESQLAKLEQTSHHDEAEASSTEDELREEITYLKQINTFHPDATRFALENLELRQQLSKFDNDRNDEAILRLHNQELAKQLRVLLHEKDALLEIVNKKGEKERWVEVQRMEVELNAIRRELDEEKQLRQANLRDLDLQERLNEEHVRTIEENRKAYEHERGELLRMRLLDTIEDEQGESKAQLSQMAENLKILHSRCQQFEGEINAREEVIRCLRDKLENTERTNRRQSEKFQELSSAMEESHSSLEDLRETKHDHDSDASKREVDTLQEQLSSLREEHETLLEEVQYLRAQLKIREASEDVDVHVQLQKAKAECDHLTEKLASYQEEKFETYMEIDALKLQLKAQKDTATVLSEQLSAFTSRVEQPHNTQQESEESQVEREHVFSHNNATSLQNDMVMVLEHTTPDVLLKDTENANNEQERLRQELFHTFEKLRETEDRVDLLNADVEQYILLKQDAEAEKQALQKQIDELRQQNAKLVGHNNHKQKLQHHVKIKEENNVLLKENTRLLSENRRLTRELSKDRNTQDSTALDDTQNLSFCGVSNLSNSMNFSMQEEPDAMNLSIVSKLQEVLGDSGLGNKENTNNLNSSFDCK